MFGRIMMQNMTHILHTIPLRKRFEMRLQVHQRLHFCISRALSRHAAAVAVAHGRADTPNRARGECSDRARGQCRRRRRHPGFDLRPEHQREKLKAVQLKQEAEMSSGCLHDECVDGLFCERRVLGLCTTNN